MENPTKPIAAGLRSYSPLPRFLLKSFNLPLRLMFKKPIPSANGNRRGPRLLCGYLLGISAFYGGLVAWPGKTASAPAQSVDELVRILKEADNRSEKRRRPTN